MGITLRDGSSIFCFTQSKGGGAKLRTHLTLTCSSYLGEFRFGDENSSVDVCCEITNAGDGAVVATQRFVEFDSVPPYENRNVLKTTFCDRQKLIFTTV